MTYLTVARDSYRRGVRIQQSLDFQQRKDVDNSKDRYASPLKEGNVVPALCFCPGHMSTEGQDRADAILNRCKVVIPAFDVQQVVYLAPAYIMFKDLRVVAKLVRFDAQIPGTRSSNIRFCPKVCT